MRVVVESRSLGKVRSRKKLRKKNRDNASLRDSYKYKKNMINIKWVNTMKSQKAKIREKGPAHDEIEIGPIRADNRERSSTAQHRGVINIDPNQY